MTGKRLSQEQVDEAYAWADDFMANHMQQRQKTLPERIAEDGITARASRRDGAPSYTTDMDDMDWWNVRLRLGGKIMTVPFGMGYGHEGKEPEAVDVLSCLISDFTEDTFEQWCSDFGLDTDSRKAYRTYNQIIRQTERLREFLGDKFEEYVYETERY